MEGLKFDDGKLPWDLLPWDCVEDVVKVLQYGANKYAPNNWQHIDRPRSRYFSACIRHLICWWRHEDVDKESGLPHLAHAICCLLFILYFDKEISNG